MATGKRKNKSAGDPSLFEYEPKEVPDEEVIESMARRKVDPASIVDAEFRAAYEKYLETYDEEAP